MAVVLSIAPFTIDDLAEEVGRWVNALPALALVVVAVSGVVLQFEMELFTRIVREYGAAQDEIVEEPVRKEGPDIFPLVIRWYPLALFVLVLAVPFVAWTRG